MVHFLFYFIPFVVRLLFSFVDVSIQCTTLNSRNKSKLNGNGKKEPENAFSTILLVYEAINVFLASNVLD